MFQLLYVMFVFTLMLEQLIRNTTAVVMFYKSTRHLAFILIRYYSEIILQNF